jgi:hypothetical protein
VYDGRGKALFPGLINCHAHLTATLQRGFNEDFGFPNSAKLAVQPASLLQGEESTLMVVVGALEAIRTGTTTLVENAGGIGRYAYALSKTGLRWVFAESIRDSENVPGPMSPDGLARSETPRFSPRLRDQGLQQINDFVQRVAWQESGSHQRLLPAAGLTETSSPELLKAVRAFAEQHDLGYTIHLNQSVAGAVHGSTTDSDLPPISTSMNFSGRDCSPRTPAMWMPARSRYWGNRDHHLAPGEHGREPRRDSADSGAARRRLSDRAWHRQQHERCIRGDAHRPVDRAYPPHRSVSGVRPQPEDILADATESGARAVNQQKTLGSPKWGRRPTCSCSTG